MREDLKKRWDSLIINIENEDRRKQFDTLVEYLTVHSDYFKAPASPGYHCSYPEGLLEHSLNVAENALKIAYAFNVTSRIDLEELIIASLFHDLGKALVETDQPYYIKNEPTPNQKKWGFVPDKLYKYNDSGHVFLTVPQRSVRIITQFIDISDEAYQAILIHDSMYVEENKPYACKETPMALVLQMADSWAGFTMEERIIKAEDNKSYRKILDDKIGVHGREVRRVVR